MAVNKVPVLLARSTAVSCTQHLFSLTCVLQHIQAASAFASAGGSAESQLDIPALRLAMLMVLGRAVKESEAESCLRALQEKSLPRQPQGRQIAGQTDAVKVVKPSKKN